MNKNCTMTQSQMRALLIDAFSRGRDFQRASQESGPVSQETGKLADEWSAYLRKMCGKNY